MVRKSITIKQKPTPKSGFIPSEHLGDVLQVWNFFATFSEMFKFEDIHMEELYAALSYTGEKKLALIDDIHKGLLSFFVPHFTNENAYQKLGDEGKYPFIFLLREFIDKDDQDGEELSLIWTEFLRVMCNLPQYQDQFSASTRRYIDELAEKTTEDYNSLEFRKKLKILCELINCVYDTEQYREYVDDQYTSMKGYMQDREEILKDMRACEMELRDCIKKIQTIEKIPEMSTDDITTFNEEKRKVKNIEVSVTKYKSRLDYLKEKIRYETIMTSTFLGYDSNKNEYWTFLYDPSKIYVKTQEHIIDDASVEKWLFYDTIEEANDLMNTLDEKDSRESKLIKNIKNALEEGNISFENKENQYNPKENGEMADEEEKQREILAETKNKKSKRTKSRFGQSIKKAPSESSKQEQADFWLAQIMEYGLTNEDRISQNRSNSVYSTRSKRGTSGRQTQRSGDVTDEEMIKIEAMTLLDDTSSLSVDKIRSLILKIEGRMQSYLDKWGSMWGKPSETSRWFDEITYATSPMILADLLTQLEQYFHVSKTIIGKRKFLAVESDADNDGLTEELSDDEVESSANSTDDSSPNKSAIKDQKQKMIDEKRTRQEEEERHMNFKRIPQKLWKFYGDRVKKAFRVLCAGIDNMASCYFAAKVFYVVIDQFVDHQNKKYFSKARNGKEYREMKYGKKQKAEETKMKSMDLEDLQSYKMDRKPRTRDTLRKKSPSPETYVQSMFGLRERKGRKPLVDDWDDSFEETKPTRKATSRSTSYQASQSISGKSTNKGSAIGSRLRDRGASQKNQRNSQLDEVANLRKSSRLTRQSSRNSEF